MDHITYPQCESYNLSVDANFSTPSSHATSHVLYSLLPFIYDQLNKPIINARSYLSRKILLTQLIAQLCAQLIHVASCDWWRGNPSPPLRQPQLAT